MGRGIPLIGSLNAEFYRHVGVYGICVADQRLLVIEKGLGPYTGQYDLPGGRLEDYESLEEAIRREFDEETGYAVQESIGIGVCDFNVLWTRKDNTEEHLHHIAMMYKVQVDTRHTPHAIESSVGQDSRSALWVPLSELSSANSSPLVLKAVQWANSQILTPTSSVFDYRRGAV